jgi:glycine hydroxymethyltransferase
MGPDQMKIIGLLMTELLRATKPAYSEKLKGPSSAKVEIEPNVLAKVQLEVKELLSHFPLYPELQLNSNPSTMSI